jgi:glycosyltransferase involved in cell wall biosynthesis
MNTPQLAILLPCYNEEEVLPLSIIRLIDQLDDFIDNELVSQDSYLCFINDGSRDQTWQLILNFVQKYPNRVKGICLSRNFGHQAALLAGLETMTADCYITIDADLQDDIAVMREMLQNYVSGVDIVYGVKRERKADSLFKRATAEFFYKIMGILGTHTVYNHADFRLMSRRAVEELKKYQECHLFLRGLVTELGFSTACVYEDISPREQGMSKYTLVKMLRFAWTGITSFSDTPMKLALVLGFSLCFIALFIGMITLCEWLSGITVSGWTSLTLTILFFSGLQMLLLGIMGEYIGKIYMQSKHRPRYIIQDRIE